MADSKQVNVRYSIELLQQIDAAVGDENRGEWIREACCLRLSESTAAAQWKHYASILEGMLRRDGHPNLEYIACERPTGVLNCEPMHGS